MFLSNKTKQLWAYIFPSLCYGLARRELKGGAFGYSYLNKNKKKNTTIKNDNKEYYSAYKMSSNGLEEFDLSFLKLENNKKNMLYSPLSIKYALSMLSSGASGSSKKEIDAVIGDYKSKKYINSENMSFANAMFIKDKFKEQVKKRQRKSKIIVVSLEVFA